MPQQKLLEAAILVALLVATATKNKENKVQQIIKNRIVIALVSALGTFIATEYPTVHNSICSIGGF